MYKGGTYLALGDSITFGTNLTANGFPYSTYAAQIQQAVYKNYGNCKLINKAIAGNSSADLVNSVYYWGRCNPDLVSINIGTNDCGGSIATSTFQTNLETIVNLVKEMSPQAEIILCSISQRGDAYANSLDPYRAVVQTVASEKGTFLCHFENAWTPAQNATYLGADNLHPNLAGHTALFNTLYPIVQQTNFVKNLGK
jgi:lysophospholipase L1-like esterase